MHIITSLIIIDILLTNITKYLISENYIKIKKKPVLSILNPKNNTLNKTIVSQLREKAKQNLIGEIFLFYPFTGNFKKQRFLYEYNASFDFSNFDLFEHKIRNPNILYYSGIIYKNLILNELNFNYSLYRTCNLNYKNFKDYNPEKFYISNNLIFDWEKINYEKNEGIVFIDSWNDYKEGKYLENDDLYGYASINSFSKSLFNLPYQQNDFTLNSSQGITIAIQIHVFYEHLLSEIINKLNLMPVKYDLYISTTSEKKTLFIRSYLSNSNANNYEIKIFKNIGIFK